MMEQKTADKAKAEKEGDVSNLKPPAGRSDVYIIKEGDTLGGISKRLNISREILIKLNGIEDENLIKVGDALTLPSIKSQAKNQTKLQPKQFEHLVESGDFLGKIAEKYGVSVEKILAANPQLEGDPHHIVVGAKLTIPGLTTRADAQLASRGGAGRGTRKNAGALSGSFMAKLDEYAEDLNIEPEWLLACMHFETSGTFSTTIQNGAGSGAVGLIQFTGIALKELNRSRNPSEQLTLQDIPELSHLEQLKLVHDYFKIQIRQNGPIKSFDDCYMAILCPSAIGKPSDHILYQDGKSYSQNINLDTDRDGKITKAEASARARGSLAYVRKEFAEIF